MAAAVRLGLSRSPRAPQAVAAAAARSSRPSSSTSSRGRRIPSPSERAGQAASAVPTPGEAPTPPPMDRPESGAPSERSPISQAAREERRDRSVLRLLALEDPLPRTARTRRKRHLPTFRALAATAAAVALRMPHQDPADSAGSTSRGCSSTPKAAAEVLEGRVLEPEPAQAAAVEAVVGLDPLHQEPTVVRAVTALRPASHRSHRPTGQPVGQQPPTRAPVAAEEEAAAASMETCSTAPTEAPAAMAGRVRLSSSISSREIPCTVIRTSRPVFRRTPPIRASTETHAAAAAVRPAPKAPREAWDRRELQALKVPLARPARRERPARRDRLDRQAA